jgi:hypothetical protein
MVHMDSDIVFGNLVWAGSKQQYKPSGHTTVDDFMTNNQIFGSSLYKRSVWIDVGGYSEKNREYYEDWAFWGKAAIAKKRFYYIDEDVYLYGGGQDGMCARLGKERSKNEALVIDMLKDFKKKWESQH